jgi:hypothetical protein
MTSLAPPRCDVAQPNGECTELAHEGLSKQRVDSDPPSMRKKQ